MHKLDGLIDILHFVIMRMGLTVGSYQTIDAERTIVWLITKVASVLKLSLA